MLTHTLEIINVVLCYLYRSPSDTLVPTIKSVKNKTAHHRQLETTHTRNGLHAQFNLMLL